MGIARKGGGGGADVKACQDGLEHFFPPCLPGGLRLARMVWSTFFYDCPFDRWGGGGQTLWSA